MNNEVCPKGHNVTRVFNTVLYADCYFCHECDKVYELTATEVTKEYFKKMFNSDRFNEIKQYAKIVDAKKRVTMDDLIKLGYLVND